MHVDGTGVADPLTTGYTDYGSIGEYTISGTISGATGIVDNSNQAFFQTYPNPSNGQVIVKMVNPGEENEIKVINIMGEIILKQTTTSQLVTLDLTDSSNGIYFISVRNSNGTATIKQMKE